MMLYGTKKNCQPRDIVNEAMTFLQNWKELNTHPNKREGTKESINERWIYKTPSELAQTQYGCCSKPFYKYHGVWVHITGL